MVELLMYIGGEWTAAATGATFTVHSPVDGSVLGTVPMAAAEDAARAVVAAERDFHPWYHKTQGERSDIMCAMAEAIRRRADELTRTLVMESGETISRAKLQVEAAARCFEKNAHIARNQTGQQLPSTDCVAVVVHEAVGVVAAITSWSCPLLSAAEKIAEAIAMGNSCVLKPSRRGSLCAGALVEAVVSVPGIPEGLINLVTGEGEVVGPVLVGHPLSDVVSFTGSAGTGKKVLNAAAAGAKKCVMGMKANNPAIILPDADAGKAAAGVAAMLFPGCGQSSRAPGRIYVHEKVYDRFLEALTAEAEAQVIGGVFDESSTMGPCSSFESRDRIEGLISAAEAEGAKVHYRRETMPEGGAYISPTIVTGCTQDMALVREEVFGPVAPLIKYGDGDNLLMLINDSDCGMCGYVFTENAARGMDFINYLNVGALFVNCAPDATELPEGSGVKLSGMGKSGGGLGLLEYTIPKLICVKYK